MYYLNMITTLWQTLWWFQKWYYKNGCVKDIKTTTIWYIFVFHVNAVTSIRNSYAKPNKIGSLKKKTRIVTATVIQFVSVKVSLYACELHVSFLQATLEAVHRRCSKEKVFWKYAAILQENTHTKSVISIKLLCSFTEITLRHGCSPVNFLNIFRTPSYKNASKGLLLQIHF